jgi:5-methyltetrahydrofolate--homocysteine methyltransferase
MTDLSDLSSAIIDGNRERTLGLIQTALDQGLRAEEIVNQWMIPAMREVGERFERGEYFVPEMLVAARAMKAGLTVLRPFLAQQDVRPLATVVIGTVRGDLHDIGKNLVAIMLEGAGFRVVDVGVDVPPQRFTEAVAEHGADILGLSALLTTTMIEMETVIRAVGEAGLRQKVKILVGGAPITQQFADRIGADGWGESAATAVRLARRVLDLDASMASSRYPERRR